MAPTGTSMEAYNGHEVPKVASIKTLADSAALTFVPSEYTYTKNPNEQGDANDPEHSIPILIFPFSHQDLLINEQKDFLKVIVHPQFNSLYKPAGYSEVSLEFSKRTREVATEMLKGISESLGLEGHYIVKAMNWDRGLQILAANYYPACPQPDKAIGLPPHTDHGLVTLLIQNEMGGLEVKHKDQWVLVNVAPGAFVVTIGDQMQILTKDKYKSIWHRAVVNNKATRISIAVPRGPSLDTPALPIPELLEREGQAPKYIGMTYEKFIASPAALIKPFLDHLRVKHN
ncbi:flavonol synthase/flavanone 3-hydroxylase-like [Prunus avium]|uniref:Flavonol synthase/flavanone 3-hydroxylase-like n=1 Tax=Prunus avium TaxID=42229 RepID=A0A6P5TQ81_PRUAV|nr:flavonol synthase/flavanone 3-hydroxylase-like [Prunus avium]